MVLYIILFFTTTALVISKKKPMQMIGLSIAFLLIIMLVGLRNELVGIDTRSYYNIFRAVNNHDPINIEPLYTLFNRCIFLMGGGPKALVFAATLIIFGSIIGQIYDYSPSLSLSLVILYGLGPFFFLHSGIRQGIAIALLFYSIRFIIQRKLIAFLIIIIIAGGFHYSALIFLPLYFLSKFGYNRFFLFICWVTSIIFIFKQDAVFLVLRHVLFFLPVAYLKAALDPDIVSKGIDGLGLRLVFMQIVFMYLLYVYNKVNEDKDRLIIFLSIFGIIFSNILINAGYIGRISMYFSLFIVLGLPVAIQHTFKGYGRILISQSLYACCVAFFIRELIANSYNIFPYLSIFD